MKKIILIFIFFPLFVNSQVSWNMNLLGSFTFPTTKCNDIWGWVDANENEFALVGLRNGVSCVDVTIPSTPVEMFFISDVYSTWRDIKTFGNFAYVTTESDAGLLIIDLSDMTGNTYYHVKDFVNPITGIVLHWEAAHDLFIDEFGICYIFGASNPNIFPQPPNGVIFLDLVSDPINPIHLGQWNEHYVHDGMARSDTMYLGCIYDGSFQVVDVSDKANPSTIGQAYTPDLFTHNAWVSDDGNYVFTTDEKPNAFIGAYDISDLNNIYEVDRIQSNPGSSSIPHNTFVDGNFLITSYYRDGTTVHDITYPNYMIQVGSYDSYLGSGNGFDGCWGTYPFLPSGNIISSDINSFNGQGILNVYGRDFRQACYLTGEITDCFTNTPISNVNIQILNTNILELSNLNGEYQTAVVDSGLYEIVFSSIGYENDTIIINLEHGILDSLNLYMCPPCSSLNLSTNNTYDICSGDSVIIGPNSYFSSGIYIDTLSSISGCDSIITTNLTVSPSHSFFQQINICYGEVFTIAQNSYNTSGTYYDTLNSVSFCDSIVITQLTVAQPSAILTFNPPMLNMLANGGTPPYNYELNGPGGFNYFMQNTNGIQSVNPSFSGIYNFYAIDSAGCTSDVVTYSIEIQTNIVEYNESQRPPIFFDILGRRVDFLEKLKYRP